MPSDHGGLDFAHRELTILHLSTGFLSMEEAVRQGHEREPTRAHASRQVSKRSRMRF